MKLTRRNKHIWIWLDFLDLSILIIFFIQDDTINGVNNENLVLGSGCFELLLLALNSLELSQQ